MPFTQRPADKFLRKKTCIACGASLGDAPATVIVAVHSGRTRVTTWATCGCGAMSRFERVRRVRYVGARGFGGASIAFGG